MAIVKRRANMGVIHKVIGHEPPSTPARCFIGQTPNCNIGLDGIPY